mmetsp:Transcript_51802/g.145983  ORF Transcript_51802/g.145983 Transcript_51802/m.145983 type:complete len:84 (+) Transcript_51802:687-938(+)
MLHVLRTLAVVINELSELRPSRLLSKPPLAAERPMSDHDPRVYSVLLTMDPVQIGRPVVSVAEVMLFRSFMTSAPEASDETSE